MFCFALRVRNEPCPQSQSKQGRQGWAFHLPGAQGVPRWPLPPSCPTSCAGSRLTSHWGPIWLLVWVRALCSEALQAALAEGRPCPPSVRQQQLGTQSTCHTAGGSRPPLCPWGATSVIIPPLAPWGRVGEHRIIVADHVLEREPHRPEAGGKRAMKTALCLQPPYTGLVFLRYDNWVKH